jgi:hypothetical protein
VVEDGQLADAVVLKATFDDALLEVAIKSEHLYIINKFILFGRQHDGSRRDSVIIKRLDRLQMKFSITSV